MFLRPRNVGDRATVAPMPLKTRFTPSRSHFRGPAIADLCRFLRAIRTTSPYDAPACTSGIDAAFDASPCSADTSSGGPYPAYGSGRRLASIMTGLVSTFTRQPDDPFVQVLPDVDEGLVELQVHPGEDL